MNKSKKLAEEEPEPTFKYDAHVHEIFGSNFTVTNDHVHDSYQIIHDGIVCLNFKLIEDEGDDGTVLYVSKLFKCGGDERTGPALLKLIDKLAESIPRVKYIELQDGSSIHVCTVDIDLRYLKILTTGESWYNSFGYKSVNHDANVAHNAVIINKPMHWLLSELFDQEYIEKFKTRFPELNTDLTVKEYVTAMSKEVPRSGTRTCTKEQEKRARLLFNLFHSIRKNEMLEYDFTLQKMVERGASRAGGKRNKRSGINQRNKRNKSNKRTSTKRRKRQ